MYQFVRKVHLWVGLLLAVVLLVEAATGLILAEPGWFGQAKGKPPGLQTAQGAPPGAQGQQPERAKGAAGVYGVAKGLHQGKVGNMDLGWVIDVSAVGLAVLALTGAYMAVPRLGSKRR